MGWGVGREGHPVWDDVAELDVRIRSSRCHCQSPENNSSS